MRTRHFEAFAPRCPVCRGADRVSALAPHQAAGEEDEHLLDGILACASADCRSEFPIVDGIPILLANVREAVSGQLAEIRAREDLSDALESLLGDCAGPESPFEANRQQLSTYGASHWDDLDPARGGGAGGVPAAGEGTVLGLLETGLELAGRDAPAAPALDLGCAAGRATFALAERVAAPVLGIDLHFAMLRLAARALRRGVVRYPRRRTGLVYERREFAVELAGAGSVDFWLADAAALPFADGAVGTVVALNLLDSVHSPVDVLREIARVLAPGGLAILALPYDWSPRATPVETWIGGHSGRGPDGGAGEPLLRRLLTPGGHPHSVDGFEILAEAERLPWQLRVHGRSSVHYETHLLAAARRGGKESPTGLR